MRTEPEALEAFSKLPPTTQETLAAYIDKRRPTGDFLRAVLENNLFVAMHRADMHNRFALFEICSYIYNYAPMTCWGSPEVVDKWLKNR